MITFIEQDKLQSYVKYFSVEMEKPSEEMMNIVNQGPIDSSKALKIEERNALFKEGYLDTETGYCVMEDGTGFVACLTKMPGVTTEMLDWWFGWYGLDRVRFQIWNPEDHINVEILHSNKNLDKASSNKDQYWDMSLRVSEDIGLGPDLFQIDYLCPEKFGFEIEKIGTSVCSTIVCGNINSKKLNAVLTHFVRETGDGVEVRTRYWIGYQIDKDKKPVKVLLDGEVMPDYVPKALLIHNAKEFTHLTNILPKLFEEEKEN